MINHIMGIFKIGIIGKGTAMTIGTATGNTNCVEQCCTVAAAAGYQTAVSNCIGMALVAAIGMHCSDHIAAMAGGRTVGCGC